LFVPIYVLRSRFLVTEVLMSLNVRVLAQFST
jgi:hypothetical protein